MKYNLAVDCGGTKVAAIAFDNNFKPIFSLLVGSVRGNSTPRAIVDGNMKCLVDGLFEHGADSIGTLCGAVQRDLADYISAKMPIEKIRHLSELEIGLSAGFISGCESGALVLSGTGSGTYSRVNGIFDFTGGYGSAVADEGSGYDIGRRAYCAAVADFEKFGPHTMLTELICEKYGKNNLRDAIFSGIYGCDIISPTSAVASAAKLAAFAADQGDGVAIKILTDAGVSLGRQAVAHFNRLGLDGNLPTVASGGVWKLSKYFADTVRTVFSDGVAGGEIISPSLEPVGGAVAFLAMEKFDKSQVKSLFLSEEFKAYQVRKPNSVVHK